MERSSIKAVIFDLDDTLLPEIDFITHVFRKVSRRVARDFRVERGPEEICDRMLRHFLEREKGRIFDWILEEETSLKPGEIRSYVKDTLIPIYRNARPPLRPYPDTIPLLERLKGGFLLGLLTNGRLEVQGWKIEATGIKGYFSSILITEELGGPDVWKPSMEPFRAILRRLGVSGRDAIYVGDNPELDFSAPPLLGLRTVRIFREGGMFRGLPDPEPPPDFHLDGLEGLEGILRSIGNSEKWA